MNRKLALYTLLASTALLTACMSPPRVSADTSSVATSAAADVAPSEAEILWDTWGVPHISATDDEALMHAFGWAQIHSHADLILGLYAAARGRAAEVQGEDGFANDQLVYTLGIPQQAEAAYDRLPESSRRRLDAFVEGMNAYLDAHPEHAATPLRTVLPITAPDVLAHQQFSIGAQFLAYGELSGAQRWQEAPGSNAWAVAPSRSASGNALLLANPHLLWSGLFTWYEAQLTAPGIDAYGAALVGLPFLAIGFNDHLGWTHTVNTIDAADLYALPLDGNRYVLDGEPRPFETHRVEVRVRKEDGSMETRPIVVRRSEHGPVVAQRDGEALALRIAGQDQMDLIGQYWSMMAATNLAAFEAAVARLQMPMFNVIYADRDGHILYVFNGQIPVRDEGGWAEWSGVVPGERSETIWTRTHTYDELPRLLDPPSGWVQNANDPPWTATLPLALDPDAFPGYFAPRGMAFRPQRSARMLTDDDQISFDELRTYKHSTRSEFADRVLDDLSAVARAQGGDAAHAADMLVEWDRQTNADSRGAVLFETWARAMGSGVFAEGWDPERPLETPRGLADPSAAAQALAAAATEVAAAYGQADVAWGDARRIEMAGRDLPGNGGSGALGIFRVAWFQNIDDDAPHEMIGGDGFVFLAEFSDPVRAEALLPYGNASQPGSPHIGDQLDLFIGQALRSVWRTRTEVEANLARRETLDRR